MISVLPGLELSTDGLRQCRRCDEFLPISSYGFNSGYVDNKDRFCKDCRKKAAKKIKQIKKYAPKKSNQCDCCGVMTEDLRMDHDHITDQFRGWICHKCNTGIGYLGDSAEGIKKALEYLEKQNG